MIEVKNISKNYGDVKALSNINFSVGEGKLFGLIGADGAGKTSLFRILTTVLLPDEGSATVAGNDIVKNYKAIRHQVGYMPGKFSLYQDLTVEENLNFFASIFNTTIQENYDLIKDIYIMLEPFKNRKAGQLSGGMKQKLALSCALIHRPKVLFLDEPTTGVDPVSRKEFWEMLKKLKKEGITILVSTPYMDEAALCEEIALIQNGEILQVNTPEEIVNTYPFKLYEFKTENNYRFIQKASKIKGVEHAFAFGQGVHISVMNQSVLESLNQLEISIKSKEKIKPTIEDCFMHLLNQNQ